jgi:DNA topoisomerase-1
MQKVLPYDKMKLNKTLVIVESPFKCKKIEKILGYGYKVIACCGHLREIQSLSDISKDYNPKYTIITSKKKIVENIKKEIKTADDVILATDDDREGEGIAWHICVLFSLPFFSTKRIKYSEITEEAILNAIKYPSIININRVNSQITRQMIDLMVGFSVSPMLWNNIKHSDKNHLSAGRCQTPALKIIYDRYIENIDNIPKQVFSTIGYFTNKFISFELSKRFELEEEVEKFLESSKDFKHIFLGYTINKYVQEPPKPLTTSRMLQISPYPPKETMKILQTLYEDGLITYIRTDSYHYSNEFITSVKKYIIEKYNDEKYIGMIRASEEKAHEPIRPTNIYLKQINSTSSHKEIKIYNLIWEISLQSCMSDSVYDSMDISITAPNNLNYKKNSKKILFEGWEIVKDKKINKEYDYLLCLKEGIIPYKKINSISSMIGKEMHYTESSLIKKIEHYDFGRPSTYSSLVEKIKERKYVLLKDIVVEEDKITYEMEENNISKKISKVEKVEKNQLIIQPLGIKVIEYIYSNFSTLFDYEYTSEMEKKLDNIENNITDNLIKDICNEVSLQLKKEYVEKEEISNIIRKINDETSIRKSKHGEYIYHKKKGHKKPVFISLEKFEEDYLSCSEERIIEWIRKLK